MVSILSSPSCKSSGIWGISMEIWCRLTLTHHHIFCLSSLVLGLNLAGGNNHLVLKIYYFSLLFWSFYYFLNLNCNLIEGWFFFWQKEATLRQFNTKLITLRHKECCVVTTAPKRLLHMLSFVNASGRWIAFCKVMIGFGGSGLHVCFIPLIHSGKLLWHCISNMCPFCLGLDPSGHYSADIISISGGWLKTSAIRVRCWELSGPRRHGNTLRRGVPVCVGGGGVLGFLSVDNSSCSCPCLCVELQKSPTHFWSAKTSSSLLILHKHLCCVLAKVFLHGQSKKRNMFTHHPSN